MTEDSQLSDNAKRLAEHLEKHKTTSHRFAKETLKLEGEEYEKVKLELLQAGRAFGLRCRGGGLRLPEEIALPGVDEDRLEEAKNEQARAEQQTVVAAERAEKELYPYLQQWAINSGYDKVRIIGDNHRREAWENPDLLAITCNHLEWMVGTDIEITSMEVKLSFDVKGLWQSAHYRTFSHYVYLACYKSPELLRNKLDGRLYEMVVEMGLGVLSLTPAGAGGRGVKCIEINSPMRQTPRLSEVDLLLASYADLMELEKPGRRIITQMQKA